MKKITLKALTTVSAMALLAGASRCSNQHRFPG